VVKALACEVVYETDVALSRPALADLTARAWRTLGKPISRSTVWRMLHADALKPWRYKYWIFPRGPKDHILEARRAAQSQTQVALETSRQAA